MKSCLCTLAGGFCILVALGMIFYLSSLDGFAIPDVQIQKNYTKMTFKDVCIDPEGSPSASALGIKSFDYLRIRPVAVKFNDGQHIYRMEWNIHCKTAATVTHNPFKLTDHYNQKIHIPTGSQVGLRLENGQEIIALLSDSACFVGTVSTSRSCTYAQEFTFRTLHSDNEMLLLAENRVEHVWIEATEGRLEADLSKVRGKEFMKKAKRLISFINKN